MLGTLHLHSYLLLSLCITIDGSSAATLPQSAALSYSKMAQNLISFAPPSQQPILDHQLPSPDAIFAFRGTIEVSSCGPDQRVRVDYSLSSRVCGPLVPRILYLMNYLLQQLPLDIWDGTVSPTTSDTPMSPMPIYVAANITEQLYRSKFVLGLSLKMLLVDIGSNGLGVLHWQPIKVFLKQSADELDRIVRKRNSAGLGSVILLEAELAGVNVLVEWRIWRVIDGLTIICEG